MPPLRRVEAVFTEALSHDRGFVLHFMGRCRTRTERASLLQARGRDPFSEYAGAEEDISRAVLLVAERAKLLVEPSGAVAVAALMADPGAFAGPVVAILSGGNIDPQVLLHVVRHGLASAGRFLALRVRLDDRPGSLAALLQDLAAAGANVMHLNHTRTASDLAFDQVTVAAQVETKGPEHCSQVLAHLRSCGYQVQGD